jgi:hypothetical protein
MSYGNYEVSYSDDQIGVGMISDFDQVNLPGLYDTTRADIFKMVSSPCVSCDAPFKGMPQQMQYGPLSGHHVNHLCPTITMSFHRPEPNIQSQERVVCLVEQPANPPEHQLSQ